MERAPDDSNYLIMKVASILGLKCTLRMAELLELDYKDINVRADNMIEVTISRVKQKGPKERSAYFITDERSVQIVKKYMECFSNQVLTMNRPS